MREQDTLKYWEILLNCYSIVNLNKLIRITFFYIYVCISSTSLYSKGHRE